MSYDDKGFKFLAIKNWEKYQVKDRNKRDIRLYVKDYCGQDIDDPEYSKLTQAQRYLVNGCRRIRGRSGRNLRNDPAWVALALGVIPKERSSVPGNLHALIEQGFLLLTHDEVTRPDSESESDSDSDSEDRDGDGGDADASRSPRPSDEKSKTSGALGSLPEANPKSKATPAPSSAAPSPAYRCACKDHLCDWSEPIVNCSLPLSRIADAVYYQRHVKKNDWFIVRLNKGFVRQQWKRLVDDTPEEYVYDPDPLWEEYEKHFDGIDNPPTKMLRPRRDPRPEEREEFRQKIKNPDFWQKHLVKKDCPRCEGKGSFFVSDFPDAQVVAQRMIGHEERCSCVLE